MRSLILLALLLAGLPFVGNAQQTLRLLDQGKQHTELADIGQYHLVTLDLTAWRTAVKRSAEDKLHIRLKGATVDETLSLQRYDIRSANYKSTSGQTRRPSKQWLGLTEAKQRAVVTIDDNFVMANWRNGKERWQLEPLFRLDSTADKTTYLLYRESDIEQRTGKRCETIIDEDTPPVNPDTTKTLKINNRCATVEIGLASDFEMFESFGSAASVESFMLGTLVSVQTDYDDAFDSEINFVVSGTDIAISEATDPWSNTTETVNEEGTGLLQDFRAKSNNGELGFDYDVACLWSNRDFDGSTVGVAFLSALCSNSRYQILQNFSSNASALRVLWSHELGHNFGAQHDEEADGTPIPNFIMTPFINVTSNWSENSLANVNGFVNLGPGCLSGCVSSQPISAQASVAFGTVYQGSSVPFFARFNGPVNSLSWSFPGGSPSTSSEVHPIVTYPTPGNYTATLNVSGSSGSDASTVNIIVSDDNTIPLILQYHNFEAGFGDITLSNPDGANTWGRLLTSGVPGDVSAVLDNYNNSRPGQVDGLVLPAVDLTEIETPVLTFDYAYRRFNADNNDQLRVRVSSDGQNFTMLFTGLENGSGNFATGPDQRSPFSPGAGISWCTGASVDCIEVDLSDYTGAASVTITIENINDFGQLMYVDNIAVTGQATTVLPVAWLDFTATANSKVARLAWAVDQTPDHAGFTVERSSGTGDDWRQLGWVVATAGENNVDYTFTDGTVAPGQTYVYRLRQQDLDGTISYSDLRSVTFGQAEATSVFPNPAGDRVRISSPMTNGNYELLTLAGKRLHSGSLREGTANLDLTGLPAGIYLVRASDHNGRQAVIKLFRR